MKAWLRHKNGTGLILYNPITKEKLDKLLKNGYIIIER